MSDNHRKFQSHLSSSRGAVAHVNQWLTRMGYEVHEPSSTVATQASQWKSHIDSGDLYIQQRVEVKRLSISFTSSTDWPFKDFIVCAKHSYDQSKPKPYSYVILSTHLNYAAVVYVATTFSHWTTGTRSDRRYEAGYRQEFYLCPLNLVVFREITEPDDNQTHSKGTP